VLSKPKEELKIWKNYIGKYKNRNRQMMMRREKQKEEQKEKEKEKEKGKEEKEEKGKEEKGKEDKVTIMASNKFLKFDISNIIIMKIKYNEVKKNILFFLCY
jgi:hypothetical protein